MKRADEAAKLAANLAKETMPLQKALPASGQWLAGYYIMMHSCASMSAMSK